jgi:hypothetical protein
MKPHKLALLAGGLLTATFSYAQDNIVLRNGEEIAAKVLEVSPTELKYRKTTNPDGPIYTSPVRDVLLIKYANGTKDNFGTQPTNVPEPQLRRRRLGAAPATPAPSLDQLRYHSRLFNRRFENGTGQVIGRNELTLALRPQPDALRAFEHGQSLRTWSAITGGAGIALIGVGAGLALSDHHGGRNGRFGWDNDHNRFSRRSSRVGAALAGGGVVLGLTSVWLNHRATVHFRRAAARFNGRTPVSMHLQPTTQNVGIGAMVRF